MDENEDLAQKTADETDKEADKEPTVPKWMSKQLSRARSARLAERTQRIRAEEETKAERERRERLEAEVEALRAKAGDKPSDEPARKRDKSVDEIKAEVRAEMEKEMREDSEFKEFDAAINDMIEEGHKAIGQKEWEDAVGNFKELGGIIAYSKENGILDDVLRTDAPGRALYLLGKDIERTEEIAAMKPWKRVREMNKMVAESLAKGKKTVSKAPAPIEPLGGGGGAAVDDMNPKSNISDWMKARREQVKQSGRRRLMGIG